MSLAKIVIIILLAYILYRLYNKLDLHNPIALLDTKPLKSALKKSKTNDAQFYEINNATAETIVDILNDKFIKYKYVKFNVSNIPVLTKKLKPSEAKVLIEAITKVFNESLRRASVKLMLVQIIPLYKMETDIEASYSLQVEYAVDADVGVAVENKIIRLQLSVIVHKRDIQDTFFDQVILSNADSKRKIDKIYITQVKRINTLDNLYDMGNSMVQQGEFGLSLMVREKELNRVNTLHAIEMNNQYDVEDE